MNERMLPATNALPGVPWVESPFFEQFFRPEVTEAETLRVARDLNERGFAVIDFPDPALAERAGRIRSNLDPRFDWEGWRSRTQGLRIQDAWNFDEDVRAIAANARVLALLSRLYGRQAWPFQTLSFPVGTEQHYHSDALHFNSVPERFMCGVWVAFEDVDPSCGPLLYYPGSHRWPIYGNEVLGTRVPSPHPGQGLYEPLWEALVRVHGVQPQRFLPRKGQALIWNANLLHGGDAHHDRSRTRWSQVTHYFFEDCAYFTPMYSEIFLGRIAFRRVHDIATGRAMPNLYGGEPIDIP